MILPKLFAVVQMDKAKAWCHGSCGRALAAPFELVPGAPAVACKSEDCPHRAEDMESPATTTIAGVEHELHLRVLEPVKKGGK